MMAVFSVTIFQQLFLYAELGFKKHFFLSTMLKTVVLINIFVGGGIKGEKNSIYLKCISFLQALLKLKVSFNA